MRTVTGCLIALAVPALALAQSPAEPTLSLGPAWILAGGQQGGGVQLSVIAPLGIRINSAHLTANAFFLGGNTGGAPSACAMVQEAHCFGRAEQLRVGGLGVGIEASEETRGFRVRLHSQAGVYGQYLTASELEGPSSFCFNPAGVLSLCPNQPPFQKYSSANWSFGPGLAFGLGASHRVWRTRLSVDLGMHSYWTGSRQTQLAMLGFGIAF